MKTILYIFVFTFLFSCGNEKTVLLPEINHSEISEIQDVSAGYLFYNETEKDSVELNRKNLISTTNWLINVDKRLTLKQAIPHIKYLQEKKENSSHKKEGTKNYFTCNDTSRKNLGFIEFTDVLYHEADYSNFSEINDIPAFHEIHTNFFSNGKIDITLNIEKPIHKNSNKLNFINDIEELIKNETVANRLIMIFEKSLTFQEYISLKSLVLSLENESIQILNNEFIY